MVEAVKVPQQTFLVSGILQEKAHMTLRICRREGMLILLQVLDTENN